MQKLKELVNLSSLCKFQLLAIGNKVNSSNFSRCKKREITRWQNVSLFPPVFFSCSRFSISRARLPRSLDQASKMLTSSYILCKFEGFQKEFLRNYYNYVHRSVGCRPSDKGGGGGEGGRSSRPWDKGEARSPKNFFGPSGLIFVYKSGGARVPFLSPPGSATASGSNFQR